MAHPAIPDTAFALIRIVALVEPRCEKLTARDVAMLDTVLFDPWDKTEVAPIP